MTSKLLEALSKLKWIPLQLIKSLLSLLLTVSVIPILLSLWFLNEFTRRLIVTPLLKTWTGGRIQLVRDGADNIFSFKKFGNSRNILILTVYKNKIDPKLYGQKFMDKVINHREPNGRRPFQKLETIYTKKFGYHCWKQVDNFDVQNHIKILQHNNNNNKKEEEVDQNSKFSFNIKTTNVNAGDDQNETHLVVTESGLMNLLSELTYDMAEDRPQWEEIIVPTFVYDHEVVENGPGIFGLRSGTKMRSARIFRCHHAYMDGASFLLMTSKCMTDHDYQQQGHQFPYTSDPLAPSRRGRWERVLHLGQCVLFGCSSLLKTFLTAATVRNRFVTRQFSGKAHHTWSPPISLSVVNDIKSMTKCTLPAILASVTGSVVRTLDERFPSFEFDQKKKHSSRQSKELGGRDSQILVGMIGAVVPYPDISPRNRYTVVNFHMSTAPMSRLERLELMQKKIQRLGNSPDSLVNLWMFQFFGKFPAFIVQSMMKNGGSPIVISNTPWATKRVNILGDEVEEIGGWVPLLAFSGLGLLVTRYCDTIRFCGVAEDACLSQEQLKFIISEITYDLTLLAQECAVEKKCTPASISV